MSAFDKYIGYMFAIGIKNPFTEWDAYKFGLIDANGDKTDKKPETKKEKDSVEGINNVCRKIKKIITKYVGDNKAINFLIASYLLHEKVSEDNQKLVDEISEVLNEKEHDQLLMIINTLHSF